MERFKYLYYSTKLMTNETLTSRIVDFTWEAAKYIFGKPATYVILLSAVACGVSYSKGYSKGYEKMRNIGWKVNPTQKEWVLSPSTFPQKLEVQAWPDDKSQLVQKLINSDTGNVMYSFETDALPSSSVVFTKMDERVTTRSVNEVQQIYESSTNLRSKAMKRMGLKESKQKEGWNIRTYLILGASLLGAFIIGARVGSSNSNRRRGFLKENL